MRRKTAPARRRLKRRRLKRPEERKKRKMRDKFYKK
jgi:hypothetical protein